MLDGLRGDGKSRVQRAHHKKGPTESGCALTKRRRLLSIWATLDQIALSDPVEWKNWLDWMLQLPLWLDLGSCRVVHAAWDKTAVQSCGTQDTVARMTLAKAGKRQTPEGSAVDWLLRG